MTEKMLLLSALVVAMINPGAGYCTGAVDAVTVTHDGSTYMFEGSDVWKYEAGTSQIAAGFPKSISSVFAGLPNDVDAALHYPNNKTYIFKGSQYWRLTNEAMDSGYPLDIGANWIGVPDNLDAAFVWSENNKPYFIKGDVYYRYSVPNHAVDPGYPSSLSSWNIPGNQVSAAVQWINSRTYFFTSNGEYYRYNDGQSNVDAGYPADTAPNWQKCSCSGKVDAVTVTQDGSTYIFERINVWKYEAGTSQVAAGFPKSISSVFAGLPNDVDAALHYPNGKTYIFKGSQYWRLTNEAMDSGYPLDIGENWIGLPDNLDAAFVWSENDKPYFIKGDVYYRYSVPNHAVDPGYPSSLSSWNIPGNQVSAAVQWTNSRTYFFTSSGEYYRYNDGQSNVDDGYPADTATNWQSCA